MGNAMTVLSPTDWTDYELVDSGDGAKLERFADYLIARPDPRAIWKPMAPQSVWDKAHATFIRSNKEEGQWSLKTPPPSDWSVRYRNLTFTLKPTSFKHVGIFPEQAVNWDWIMEKIGGKKARVLNLFAYTGGATLAALSAGAEVTHVDSVRGTIEWTKANIEASNFVGKPVRWIIEDAHKFASREARRGNTYDAIILDPPRFGRGSKGETWKIEEDLPKLLDVCKMLLTPNPLFILINAYTADLSSFVIHHLLTDMTKNLHGTHSFGELGLRDTTSGRLLPNGIFARWSA